MPDDGHVPSAMADAQPGLILVELYVQYPVDPVFDAPMPTGKGQQSLRTGISSWETTDGIAHFHLFLAFRRPLAL